MQPWRQQAFDGKTAHDYEAGWVKSTVFVQTENASVCSSINFSPRLFKEYYKKSTFSSFQLNNCVREGKQGRRF